MPRKGDRANRTLVALICLLKRLGRDVFRLMMCSDASVSESIDPVDVQFIKRTECGRITFRGSD